MPFVSFDAVSYVAGLTPLRPHWFGLATLAGVAPVSLAIAWSGDRVATAGSGWLGIAVLLAGGVTLLPLGWRLLKRQGDTRSDRERGPDA